jgi:hypothetical protein
MCSNLKKKCSWSMIVPLILQKTAAEGGLGFVERVKREFARIEWCGYQQGAGQFSDYRVSPMKPL